MTQKLRHRNKKIALYLVVPYSLVLALVKPLISNANQESRQKYEYYSYSLPLGKGNLRESRVSKQIASGVTHTVLVGCAC